MGAAALIVASGETSCTEAGCEVVASEGHSQIGLDLSATKALSAASGTIPTVKATPRLALGVTTGAAEVSGLAKARVTRSTRFRTTTMHDLWRQTATARG